ncbi:MAG: Gmad2 immunoglobulin-like domain-containing protein [Bacillota bacterium]|nr:Gmad2 immunoglobulin-like domain-containing protein [Bacillota bacterium]MDW7685360.1 Gmad2 immunoglobulin-like domain-containing protein [Bacillota bacterium]
MSRKHIYVTLSFLLILLLVILPGCGGQSSLPDDNRPPTNDGNNHNSDSDNSQGENGSPAEPDPAQEIEVWIENSKEIFLAQSREIDGTLSLLVTYGEKNTGGYSVEITEIDVQEDLVEVTVSFREPDEDEAVTEAITYPYDIEEIEITELPVTFIATGAENYVPELKGIDYVKPVVAQSQWIKLFSPAPESVVERQFSVDGIANVFEGNILYRLKDASERVLVSGNTTAEMGNWRYFIVDITVDEAVPVEEKLLLELYTESAKDGSVENLVQVELELQK